METPEQEIALRQGWMGLLARAPAERLAALMEGADMPDFDFDWLRVPETGGVMVRGRMGGTGAPFNLGEMTVTRCALRLQSGEVGHAHVKGRNRAHAERAALVDALMQGPRAAEVQASVLAPLASEEAAQRDARAAKAAATKVDFFTMVRGE
ncbi:phosphonate C-P lyase system protein PhnG [Alloyangia pacifica]|uniref:Alpha-D-ribose 1-methylphosphonate 5-triphosphate synthase subunit PhnG n=1 Tax=Alloyangia pacifica TaxID=311180 RepID=A0A1I6NUX3_9RHOB|nr:phosphonate C-P lyase system protein PhnG [Alloyangia pacifica]SDH60287.1 alpha-D-ribose 1-methylphosphonate 5-triphosphate synthase subunit PhnG [Alloyangia pacifica]SFS31670.1 alpha-D-ribose 1-methylphosphonate 5-triphosphate synthase subunit PhnG [Alloyangia pacifica]